MTVVVSDYQSAWIPVSLAIAQRKRTKLGTALQRHAIWSFSFVPKRALWHLHQMKAAETSNLVALIQALVGERNDLAQGPSVDCQAWMNAAPSSR